MSYHIYSHHLNAAFTFPFDTREAAQAHFDKRGLSPERYGITERVERVTSDEYVTVDTAADDAETVDRLREREADAVSEIEVYERDRR